MVHRRRPQEGENFIFSFYKIYLKYVTVTQSEYEPDTCLGWAGVVIVETASHSDRGRSWPNEHGHNAQHSSTFEDGIHIDWLFWYYRAAGPVPRPTSELVFDLRFSQHCSLRLSFHVNPTCII